MNIRMATKADLPQILPLMTELGFPCTSDELQKRFDAFMRLDGYGIVVACKDTIICGFIAWSYSRFILADRARLHIAALIVDPTLRGQGIGTHLIKWLEDFALQYRPVVIDLTSGAHRLSTHDFYQKLGYANEGPEAKIYLRKVIT